jgi:2-methylisocitrate lyase-like PEP mutase family enzyme
MNMAGFQQVLTTGRTIAAPGVWDAASALLAEQAGFGALFVSGAALSFAHLGRPDVGLLGMDETAAIVARIAERVSVPVLVDLDQGFGGVPQVQRAVRAMERAGAAAVQIEDQVLVKPAEALAARPLVPLGEMLGKLAAALDARSSDRFWISARTDAVHTAGVDAALERAAAFAEAGADMVLVEGLATAADLRRAVAALGGRAVASYNFQDGRVSEIATVEDATAAGAQLALFPTRGFAHAMLAMETAFRDLHAAPGYVMAPGGSEIAARIGTAAFQQSAARFRAGG